MYVCVCVCVLSIPFLYLPNPNTHNLTSTLTYLPTYLTYLPRPRLFSFYSASLFFHPLYLPILIPSQSSYSRPSPSILQYLFVLLCPTSSPKPN